MRSARYRNQRLRSKNKRGLGWLWVFYFFILGLGVGFFFLLQFLWNFFSVRIEAGPTQADILALWDNGEYEDIIDNINVDMVHNPLDPTRLVLLGLSHFYQGLGYGDSNDRESDMNLAIVYLRKALLFSSVPIKDRVYYVLGKTYYHKGPYYLDLAIKYIELALKENSHLENGYEYLGLSFYALEEYEKSLEAFKKAYSLRPSPLLLLAMGENSLELGDLKGAYDYLSKLESQYEQSSPSVNHPDDNIMQKAWVFLGDIYLKEGSYSQAEVFYDKVLAINESNGLVYLRLGDIYSERDQDIVKARKAWRTAVELDPQLKEARDRLTRPVN